jgi:NADH-quinone oxidoreductase subunit H
MKQIVDFVLNLPAWVWITIIAHLLVLGTVAYLILLERKVASWVQDRIGPNRVGLGFGIIPFLKDKKMFGLGQPLADGLKFIVKEDYQARGVDKILFTLAPLVMIIVIIISIATVPLGGVKQVDKKTVTKRIDVAAAPEVVGALNTSMFPDAERFVSTKSLGDVKVGDVNYQRWAVRYVKKPYQYSFQIADLNIGVLFILAVLSLAVYGVVIGGWASNNKYSFLGGLRATANMISYEIPLGLAVLAIVLTFGTLNLETIVEQQAGYWAGFIPAWNVFSQPLTFVMFLICIHAEANRAPFDLAEAEQELVGGYHTEYSSMRFALFFLAEYAGMVTTSAVCVALFFGGWHVPGLDRLTVGIVNHLWHGTPAFVNGAVTNSLTVCIVRALAVFVKTLIIIFVFMWVRWSLPRFRFDQLMMLAWRALIPISLATLIMTAIILYFWAPEWSSAADGSMRVTRIEGWTALYLLIGNVVVLLAAMLLSLVIPAAPLTNRKMRVPGSRFLKTPVAAGA